MKTDVRRVGAAVVISGGGALLVGIMVRGWLAGALPMVGQLYAGFGALVGLALVAAGVLLYRSPFATRYLLRVAGWDVLGIAVLGVAMVLLFTYQTAVGSPVTAPVFTGAVVVGISAVAHVLIGVNDARRIRARELAREQEKVAVLNRLVRHNLRTVAQSIYGHAAAVEDIDGDTDALADDIMATGRTLAELHENSKLVQRLFEDGTDPRGRSLATLVAAVADDHRAEHPAATIEVAVPDDLTVRAGDHLRAAVDELLENALVHNDDPAPTVTVTATREGDRAVLQVSDNGPGIPEMERATVLGERAITQLEHASGLGLWLVKWVADAYGGDVAIESDGGGSTVELRLPTA